MRLILAVRTALMTVEDCFYLISTHTEGGLSFQTWEEGEITWYME
jgi:hypothetical protein